MEQKLQERSARAVRCDVAKDDSCSYAVSTAQVSLSLTNDGRRLFSDVGVRELGCAGQARDDVSAYTQVKMEDVPTLL